MCNESSLQDSAGFGLVENCVLTDPGVSWRSESCIECYLGCQPLRSAELLWPSAWSRPPPSLQCLSRELSAALR